MRNIYFFQTKHYYLWSFYTSFKELSDKREIFRMSEAAVLISISSRVRRKLQYLQVLVF